MGSFRTELPSGKSISPELRTKVMNKYAYLVSNPNVAPFIPNYMNDQQARCTVVFMKGRPWSDNMLKAMDPDRIKGQTLA